MRFIESNHRYKMFNQGFKYILEFNSRVAADRDRFAKFIKAFTEQYGPYREELPREPNQFFTKYKHNEDWRVENISREKRKRIYFKVGSDYTMMALRMQ